MRLARSSTVVVPASDDYFPLLIMFLFPLLGGGV